MELLSWSCLNGSLLNGTTFYERITFCERLHPDRELAAAFIHAYEHLTRPTGYQTHFNIQNYYFTVPFLSKAADRPRHCSSDPNQGQVPIGGISLCGTAGTVVWLRD
jgi:hypothetical protein